MATAARILANRANAQQSTGPKSPEGIDASKQNATKHGLTGKQVVIKGEDPAQYDALRAFQTVTRYLNNLERSWRKACTELESLQQLRRKEAEEASEASTALDPPIGFVSHVRPGRPASAPRFAPET